MGMNDLVVLDKSAVNGLGFEVKSYKKIFFFVLTQMGPCYTSLFEKGKILQLKVQCIVCKAFRCQSILYSFW